jgi:hypothetical protein
VGRFKGGGRPALNDQPRRWRSHPHTTDRSVIELVVGTRNGIDELQFLLSQEQSIAKFEASH